MAVIYKYTVQMASDDMINLPNFMKTGSRHSSNIKALPQIFESL
jgi:hypothetical protein